MKLSGNTILITGGASGIGLAMAESFLARGNEVAVCGRRQEKLDAARRANSALRTHRCDIRDAQAREALRAWLQDTDFVPNILVNNAAAMRTYDLSGSAEIDFAKVCGDVETNFLAPVALVGAFLPLLRKQPNPVIINILSPLARVPVANVPFYAASKAALHSYSQSLREQLRGTVEVIEIYPPSVDTDMMDKVNIHKISVAACNRELMRRLEKGGDEIWVGEGRHVRWLTRLFPRFTYKLINRSTKVDRTARP